MIKEKIRTVPHWPKQGVMFRDITTLLKDPDGFKEVIVKANVREDKIEKVGDIYKVSLKAKAIEGEANLALIKLMRKYFGKQVRIVSGFRSKKKRLELY